nr:MAG TPA: hypothetical protein [Caudoviricetes sp.]
MYCAIFSLTIFFNLLSSSSVYLYCNYIISQINFTVNRFF